MASPYNNPDFGYGPSQTPGHRPPQQQRPPDAQPQFRRQYEPYRPHNAPRQQPMHHGQTTPYNGQPQARPAAPQDEYSMSANFQNDRPFDDLAYYEQAPQWPLPAPPNAPSNRARPPPRNEDLGPSRSQRFEALDTSMPPSRMDSLHLGNVPLRTRSRNMAQTRQPTHVAHTPHLQLTPGHWIGDGHNLSSSRRPVAPPSSSRPPRPVLPERAPLQPMGTDTRRACPPSARKFPASYFPPIVNAVPFTIKEESDSLRGSAKSVTTPGRELKDAPPPPGTNPIPSNIPEYYLERHPSQDPTNGNVSADVSAMGSEYDSAAEYGAGRGESDMDDRYISSLSPSPEPIMVSEDGLVKKGRPTLKLAKQPPIPSDTDDTTDDQIIKPRDRDAAHKRSSTKGQMQASERQSRPEEARAGAGARDVQTSGDSTDPPSDRQGELSSGTGLMDASDSENEAAPVPPKKNTPPPRDERPAGHRSVSPLEKTVDTQVREILTGLERGGALSPVEAAELKSPTSGLSERAGKRRPPRLDMDVVRQAEARGSLTSLSDLIKRATRLATNLDHGKTASRLGLDWFPHQPLDPNDDEGPEKSPPLAADGARRRSGLSLTDMLASFPTPADANAPRSRGSGGWFGRKKTAGGKQRGHRQVLTDDKPPPRRTCCGLPAWAFILILTLLILLIATAVIVPVVLVVIPRHQHHGSRSVATSTPCATPLTCANGGTAVQGGGGACVCLCGAGWMGSACTVVADNCDLTTDPQGNNVSVGKAVLGAIGSAGNFSLPIDNATVLELLSATNLSCNAENALVTFNGVVGGGGGGSGARRKRRKKNPKRSIPLLPLLGRDNDDDDDDDDDDAATPSSRPWHSWIPASAPLDTPTPTPTQIPASLSSSSSSATGTGTGTGTGAVVMGSSTITTTIYRTASPTPLAPRQEYAFAGVAVLYALQATRDIAAAIAVQGSLQQFLSGGGGGGVGADVRNVSLGDGFSADLRYGWLFVNGSQVRDGGQ